MKARDFAFWLQGYFEINEQDKPLNEKQIDVIFQKVNTVEISNDVAGIAELIGYVKASIEMLRSFPQDVNMHTVASQNIKRKLNDTFVHAIDPTLKGDQKDLRDLHKGRRRQGDLPDGVQAMC